MGTTKLILLDSLLQEIYEIRNISNISTMSDTTEKKKEKFMKKAERLACWGARDELWKCMDSNSSESSACSQFRQNYELQCPASWVVHFDRKYKYEKFKAEYLQKGYERIDNENETKS